MELKFIAGTTFKRKFFLASAGISDVADYTFYLEVRRALADADPFISIDSVAANGNGSVINIDLVNNRIEIIISSLETVGLASLGRDMTYFWDLRLVHTDDSVKVLYPASSMVIQKVSTRTGKDLV